MVIKDIQNDWTLGLVGTNVDDFSQSFWIKKLAETVLTNKDYLLFWIHSCLPSAVWGN